MARDMEGMLLETWYQEAWGIDMWLAFSEWVKTKRYLFPK
jgi:hypothetical protein